ncbi:hypothetical protein P9112_010214 [Eukaryota sp. TZLM1-RC]
MCDSTSSALVTTIPQVYGTLLSDSAWTLNMRFRSFIWPDNLPHNLICKCSREITTTHLLNCKHFITFRSKVHDAVRDHSLCFSSSLADANSDTLEKLQKLHPQENFKCSKPERVPVFPEIADDLAHYFQQLIVLKINPPFELLIARLIALVKPGNGIKPDGIRPIAVGESLSQQNFFADLLDVEPGMLKKSLIFFSKFGGIGFTKSSILCQSAFLGGGKNFIYEFSRRFPDDSHLLVPNCSPYLYELSCELEKLPPQIWTKCFPQSIQEIPNRSLFNLQFCCKKLQQKLSKIFLKAWILMLDLAWPRKESRFCKSFYKILTTIPQVYGTLLSDSAWTLNMRFRSFIWPDNLPHNLICKCSREITTTHLLNCKHFITF